MEIKKNIGVMLLASAGFAVSVAPASAALVVNTAQTINEVVTVQPIIVSDSNGNNAANFFGNTTQPLIEGFIDTIWAQAGIDVNFLSANTWNNTFANWGSGGSPDNNGNQRPQSDLNQIVADGATANVTNTDPNVLNMFFVRIAAGFELLGDGSAAGLAFTPGNGVTQYVGNDLLNFTGGQETIASVVAHEIGHNLGLDHNTLTENLMNSGSGGERLSNAQITTALNSDFSVPVSAIPVPPAVILFLSGLGFFSWFGRRQHKSIAERFRLIPQAT